MEATEARTPVTLRCGFCLKLNRVDLRRAADRPTCGECRRPILLDRPAKIAEEDFRRSVLQSKAPVLVDFYADWCAPCRMIAPYIDEIASEWTGRILVGKVDTDRAPEVSARYGIRSIPTLILFDKGGEVGRSQGFEPDKLRTMIEGALS